jgi:hypothetical protein
MVVVVDVVVVVTSTITFTNHSFPTNFSFGTLIWSDPSSLGSSFWHLASVWTWHGGRLESLKTLSSCERRDRWWMQAEAQKAAGETAATTVDHSDIRGSSRARQHGRDPSGAASD